MIQPIIDFTGKLNKYKIAQLEREDMAAELRRISSQAAVLSSMPIVAYGNADNQPVSDGRPMGNVVTIPHNLGYVPLFLVYKSNGQGVGTFYNRLPFYFQSIFDQINNPGKISYVLVAWADTANLYIDIQQGNANTYSGLLSFRYYIFATPNS